MGTDASSRRSIERAAALLRSPADDPNYVILKLVPEPRHCCCFHCWPQTWAVINDHISPNGPIPDEGDALLRLDGGAYVLECHESGPEIVIYLGVATASLVLVKSVVDLLTTFLKALQDEKRKSLAELRLTRRRVLHGKVEDEIIQQITLPLSKDVEQLLDKKIQRMLKIDTEQTHPEATSETAPGAASEASDA